MTASMTKRNLALGMTIAMALVPLGAAVAQGPGPVGPTFIYEGPGTVVTGVDEQGKASTITDSGGVVCEDVDDDGLPDRGNGGTCLPFASFYDGWDRPITEVRPRGNAVYVSDAQVADDETVFQVCVDMDGSGSCGGPLQSDDEACRDVIRYSHDTATGENFNPLPVPSFEILELWQRCSENGGFPGFVVITCAGLHAHVEEGVEPSLETPHSHQVTKGTAQPAIADEFGQGDFCGGGPPGGLPREPVEPTYEKPYVIT